MSQELKTSLSPAEQLAQERIKLIQEKGIAFIFTKQNPEGNPEFSNLELMEYIDKTYANAGFDILNKIDIKITPEIAIKHYSQFSPAGVWKYQKNKLLKTLFLKETGQDFIEEKYGDGSVNISDPALVRFARELQQKRPNVFKLLCRLDNYPQEAYKGLLNTITGESKLIVLRKSDFDNSANESKEQIVGGTFPKENDKTIRSQYTNDSSRTLLGVVKAGTGVHNLLHAPDANPEIIYRELTNLLTAEQLNQLFEQIKQLN